jgi:hypothetical protein
MYRAMDDKVLACSTTHVGMEDAETASVSIGTGFFPLLSSTWTEPFQKRKKSSQTQKNKNIKD